MSFNTFYNSFYSLVFKPSIEIYPDLNEQPVSDTSHQTMVPPVPPIPPIPQDPRLSKLQERLNQTEEEISIIQIRIEEMRPYCNATNIEMYRYLWKRRIILENHYSLIKRAYLELIFKLEMGVFSNPTKSLSMSVS